MDCECDENARVVICSLLAAVDKEVMIFLLTISDSPDEFRFFKVFIFKFAAGRHILTFLKKPLF